MNEFNLEEFKKGTPAYTRNGRKATFLGFCEECESVFRLIVKLEGSSTPIFYHESGGYRIGTVDYQSTLDLIRMEGKYDHIKKGDLVMVWDDELNGHPDDAGLRRFSHEEDGKPFAFSGHLSNIPVPWADCLTVEEYVEKYL